MVEDDLLSHENVQVRMQYQVVTIVVKIVVRVHIVPHGQKSILSRTVVFLSVVRRAVLMTWKISLES